MLSIRGTVLVTLLALVAVLGMQSTRAVAADEPGQRIALLVGCSKYDNLPVEHHLLGPANDVQLMKDTLSGRFGFKDFRLLSEEAGEGRRPTAANIAREFEKLRDDARPGDRVFILMAGHGSQQPVDPHDKDEKNFEVDGLDEVFLPADVVLGTEEAPAANAITDNQIRHWLDAIRATGASIVIVFDACHSGSMVRGTGNDRLRQIRPEMLSPASAIERSRALAAERAKQAGPSDAASPFKLPPDAPDLVAIYAAQSHEPTVELDLPAGSRDAKPRGLLTYTINRVLTESDKPLTYSQLVERVQSLYAGWNRQFPTPLVEGKDRTKLVFGDERPLVRPTYALSRGEDGAWLVNAGALHGLTAGSVLAVFSGADANRADNPRGYVRIAQDGLGTLMALVEPHAYNQMKPPRLAAGDRCEVAFVDLAIAPARVAIDPRVGLDPRLSGATARLDDAEVKRLTGELNSIGESSKLFHVSKSADDADWLVRRLDPHGNDYYLVPAAGLAIADGGSTPPQVFGPIPPERFSAWLAESLARIQRVANLQKVAAQCEAESSGDLQLELFRIPAGAPGTQEPLGTQATRPGDRLGIQVTNHAQDAYCVTVLFIDSEYGIQVFFPVDSTADTAVWRNHPLRLGGRISGKTLGTEHVLLIGVSRKPNLRADPPSFSFLAQPSIEQARVVARGGTLTNYALANFLLGAAFGETTTRGMDATDMGQSTMMLRSFRVEPNVAAGKSAR